MYGPPCQKTLSKSSRMFKIIKAYILTTSSHYAQKRPF
ncbi:hypothetical protein BVG79_p2000006 (plasmid) [Ketogulonicigenium robustum]|uniref:Uncharacterized protein n=1 Tax=Ketogulonicigenium robustum TaxID=92947 RepID=A0A1W6P3E7_9RHOB|nr:hypothetical protein BVG79_p2000006 [Ketogulonicigenium robustum]